jgi:UDP-glucose 6-dehydrogenase
MHVEMTVLGCAGLVCPACLASWGHPLVGVDTSESPTVSTVGVFAGYDPMNLSRASKRMGNCNRKRFLETKALNDFAKDSFRANQTLCEPRPSV